MTEELHSRKKCTRDANTLKSQFAIINHVTVLCVIVILVRWQASIVLEWVESCRKQSAGGLQQTAQVYNNNFL